ncbi:neuropeptide FF receptor 1 like 2 [Anabas testudineus]|uniref:Neuropeptide FF receptor 1 n=1 Tax=Anabas testudineus TaxID=64144 RepID=A0A3Q1II39_ANATE|nr:neuropeptide FF receptor 1 like 2 [Anabas testudineus]WJN23578.1 neuropeptide FF receptor 1 [Channa punctata]
MEAGDNMSEEGMELEGSATSADLINSSLNGAANVTNMTFFPYYQHSLSVAASYILAYFFIFLLCMVGNILVCLIVLENRRMRTVTNLFILNLAISDLLVGIFCIPTTLVDNLITGWPFSNMVCKMSGFVQGVSVSASVFTLVAIAVERFRCIVYPLQPKPTVLVAKAAIVLIWVLAVLIMCPAAVALTVEKVPFHYMVYDDDFNHTFPLYTCYENFANPEMRKIYTAVLFAHIYLVPLTVITLMYGSIGVKLCSSVVANREPQLANATVQVGGRRGGHPMISQKKIKVIKMLILVALLFMLSWLPLWTLLMMTDYTGLDREQLDLLTSYVFPFAHWLAFSNSSVNPIIYGYYNENFKRGFQAVCKSRPFCCLVQCQLWRNMARWGKKRRPVQAPCGSTDFRDASSNHNHFVLGLRNRVHSENKVTDTAEVNRSSRAGCVVAPPSLSHQGIEMAAVHQKGSHVEESEMVSSLAVSVYQAWDN